MTTQNETRLVERLYHYYLKYANASNNEIATIYQIKFNELKAYMQATESEAL
jgi:hypothetical protein